MVSSCFPPGNVLLDLGSTASPTTAPAEKEKAVAWIQGHVGVDCQQDLGNVFNCAGDVCVCVMSRSALVCCRLYSGGGAVRDDIFTVHLDHMQRLAYRRPGDRSLSAPAAHGHAVAHIRNSLNFAYVHRDTEAARWSADCQSTWHVSLRLNGRRKATWSAR